jgi:hypothetical protein
MMSSISEANIKHRTHNHPTHEKQEVDTTPQNFVRFHDLKTGVAHTSATDSTCGAKVITRLTLAAVVTDHTGALLNESAIFFILCIVRPLDLCGLSQGCPLFLDLLVVGFQLGQCNLSLLVAGALGDALFGDLNAASGQAGDFCGSVRFHEQNLALTYTYVNGIL